MARVPYSTLKSILLLLLHMELFMQISFNTNGKPCFDLWNKPRNMPKHPFQEIICIFSLNKALRPFHFFLMNSKIIHQKAHRKAISTIQIYRACKGFIKLKLPLESIVESYQLQSNNVMFRILSVLLSAQPTVLVLRHECKSLKIYPYRI